MTSGQDLITNNWRQAECNFYAAGSGIAQGVAIGSLLTAQYWATIGAAGVGLAFEYAAGLAGCDNNPDSPDTGGDEAGIDGCSEVDNCGSLYSAVDNQPMGGLILSNCRKITGFGPNPATGDYKDGTRWEILDCNGDPQAAIVSGDRGRFAYIQPAAGSTCIDSSTPNPPIPPDCIGEPTTVEDGDCVWTFAPMDSFIDASGAVRVYYVISANNDACGGPFAYWSGPDGPTPVNPNPPDESPDPIPPPGSGDKCPDPCPDIPPPVQLPEAVYQLTGICEDVAQGEEQPVAQWSVPADRYENAVAARLDAIALMLQQHLEYKTPTCNAQPTKEGDFRTISFVSDETSPNGRNRVRKRFRYRSVSGIGLAGVVDHWRAFTWQAGPVCVAHKGAYWGTPQVWAATAEEGKRVIRHAALEAGLDPDQTGGWVISGSDNPRYGMPGTMRVRTSGGYYWITERLGSNGRPQVEQT